MLEELFVRLKPNKSKLLSSAYELQSTRNRQKQSYYNKINTDFKTQYGKFSRPPKSLERRGAHTDRQFSNNFEDLVQTYTERGYIPPRLNDDRNLFEHHPELIEDNRLENTHSLGLFSSKFFKGEVYLDKLDAIVSDRETEVNQSPCSKNHLIYSSRKLKKLEDKIQRDKAENVKLRNLVRSFENNRQVELEFDKEYLATLMSDTESFRSTGNSPTKYNFLFSAEELDSIQKKKRENDKLLMEREKRKSYFRSTKKVSLLPRDKQVFKQESPIKVTEDYKLVSKDPKVKDKVRRRLDRMASINKTTRFLNRDKEREEKVERAKHFYGVKLGTTKTSDNKFFKNLFAKLGKKLYKDSIVKLKEKELVELYEEATRTDFVKISEKIEKFFKENNQNYLKKATKTVKPCLNKQFRRLQRD